MRKHYFQWQNFLVGSEESRVICDLELSKNVPLYCFTNVTTTVHIELFRCARRQSIHSRYLPARGWSFIRSLRVGSDCRPPSLSLSLDFIVGPVRVVNRH